MTQLPATLAQQDLSDFHEPDAGHVDGWEDQFPAGEERVEAGAAVQEDGEESLPAAGSNPTFPKRWPAYCAC